MEKIVRSVKEWSGHRKQSPELSRSQYSLVSTAELSAGAVQLWVGLPAEVKYDPSLSSLRQLYEKEHGKTEVHTNARRQAGSRPKRLPLVSSAPHLHNQPARDVSFVCGVDAQSEKKILENADKKQTKMARARHYTKMSLLLACWIFFTAVFLMYSEKEEVVMNTFLAPGENKNRVSLGWTALLGAILLLTLADREDLEPVLHRVEWSTLLFFAALFVLMEALSKLGLIEFIGNFTEALIMRVDESARLAVAILLMLWVSGVTSAFVDNIPLTTMMIRIVTSLGTNPNLNLPLTPLVWALSFGACLGGNGTLIGASANVVCAGVAEQHGYRFTFLQFFKVGFPVMIGHLIVASGYLMLCHCVFAWH